MHRFLLENAYFAVKLESRDNELCIYITTFPAYLLELLPAAEAERSDGAGHCRCAV
jgi:hypothetical protein